MRRRIIVLLALAAIVAASLVFAGFRGKAEERRIGLFTSLPILWNEAAELKGLLDPPAAPHWARTVLQSNGKVVALDTLLELQRVDLLVAAQPRPLLPEENVALDDWVRKGGHAVSYTHLTLPTSDLV